jgi:hypothetical protein
MPDTTPPKKDPQNKVITIKGKTASPMGPIVAATSKDIEYTPTNTKSRLDRIKHGFIGSETEGLKVDASGHTAPKKFENRVIVSPGGYTRIVGNDNTIISEGPGHTKKIQDDVAKATKKVRITNEQRIKNARMNNLVGGTAKDVTEKEIGALQQMEHATGQKMAPEVKAEMENEDKRASLTQKRVDDRNKGITKTVKVKVSPKKDV